MNYIITNNKEFYNDIGDYNFCNLEDMVLPKTIAVDTETTGLNPREGDMFAIQIGTGKDNYLIDMQTHNNGIKFEEVIPYLEGHILVGHNFTFDLTFMYAHGFYPDNVMDTFIASKLLYNGYPKSYRHGFGYVMERELGVVYDKSEQQNIHRVQLSTSKAIQYCFNDVDRLVELMRVLWDKLVRGGYKQTAQLHFGYIKGLAYMENCGLPIDTDLWQEKMKQDLLELKEQEDRVIKYIWENLPQYRDNQMDLFGGDTLKIMPQITSNKQMIPVFQDFEINVITDEGKESISEDQINKSDHEFVNIWLDYKHAVHAVSNFGQTVLDKVVDGRIYTSFNPILDTARISTRKGGINFLNFPANSRTRECFKAKEGFKMIVADYDGQENSVGADLHQDAMMLASLLQGADLHCAFAKLLFEEIADLSDDEIKKNHKEKRTFAKAPRFAFAYGGNGYTIAKNQNLPMEEGHRIEAKFKELHSGVYEWGEKVFNQAVKVGYIESAGGFKLHLPFFDEYQQEKDKLDNLGEVFWKDYKSGKEAYKLRIDEETGIADLTNPLTYQEKLYLEWKSRVSKVAKTKARYMRLCLNNPVQTTSAHQTKLAVVYLFKHILEKGHVGKVFLCNVPHDEIVLEVADELVDEYQFVLGDCMRRGGDYFLTSGKLKMGADANVGLTWDEAK